MAAVPGEPGRSSENTVVRTCNPRSRTRLPGPCRPCFVLIHRQPQLAHDLAQVVQRRFGVTSSAQDHEIVGIGHKASAETSLKAELLPPLHKPAHVEVRQ